MKLEDFKHSRSFAGASATLAIALVGCGGEAVLEGEVSPSPVLEITKCGSGAIRFSGKVAGETVEEDWCTAFTAARRMRGPLFDLEYHLLDEGIGPVFLANGEPAPDYLGTSAIDEVVMGWPEPLWSPQSEALCGGPGSLLTQRNLGRDFPEVPVTELYVPSLSRLGPCQPGNETVTIDNETKTASASFGSGFETEVLLLDSAVSGEFRVTLGNGSYVYARLAEPLADTPGAYPIAEALAWYRGEFYCAGTGFITFGEQPGAFVIDITGLGSAGRCPGEPVDGELTVYWLWAPLPSP